jgi:hypothetical protein
MVGERIFDGLRWAFYWLSDAFGYLDRLAARAGDRCDDIAAREGYRRERGWGGDAWR